MSNKPVLSHQRPDVSAPIKVNLDDLEKVKCPNCEGEIFDTVWYIRKVPAMLSATGKASLFPTEYFRCLSCLTVTNIIHNR